MADDAILNERFAAFTRMELVVSVAVVAVLGGLLLVGFRKSKAAAMVAKCATQQKASLLGLKTYANDGGNSIRGFPTKIPLATLSANQGPSDSPLVLYFRAAAKELETPIWLWCPGERRERLATNWASLSRSNISYFLSLDAQPDSPEMIMLGDRHFETELTRSGDRLELNRNVRLRWGRTPHDGIGQFALADGSVQRSLTTNLAELVVPSLARIATNRLESP